MIRYATVGDPQRFFVEDVSGTALDHLQHGLFEAHARDEAGHEDEAGHKQMWFAAPTSRSSTPSPRTRRPRC